MRNSRHIILFVEDSDEDFYTAKRAFTKAGVANEIYRCVDGEDALDYLYRRGKYTDRRVAPLPNMIFLDLNLPKLDGKEVLAVIKKDSHLCDIPVVILTTSSDERDIEKCYEAGANSYIQKPVGFENFMKMVQELKNYWFEVVILPKIDNKL